MSQPAADAAPALRTPEDPVAPLNTVDGRPGYLGLTSHSAVYAETRSCLSILQDFPSWLLPEGSDRQDAQQPWDDSELLASPARDMWLVVLPRRVLASLSELFGAPLGSSRSHARLQQLARFLTTNTARPFREELADPEEWLAQFTGANLRWESIGLLFSFNEMGIRGHDKNSPEADEWRRVSRVCLGLCIDLSRL
ncbi:hypothetical protein PLIIFM63780_006885 [Purpureocillium lilacinum]|uniref:uncharacterized protein n=1 Tax=Purpureocillium lilacinum TaxID=33203 RepID=UPI0020801B81|nr:hypothetical protein PLICBS_006896 [Purpureocillium lilacinum]GJN83336.1 hypothetical protein PLIIFM63780_006885 [Purpureocillium lilacinum]